MYFWLLCLYWMHLNPRHAYAYIYTPVILPTNQPKSIKNASHSYDYSHHADYPPDSDSGRHPGRCPRPRPPRQSYYTCPQQHKTPAWARSTAQRYSSCASACRRSRRSRGWARARRPRSRAACRPTGCPCPGTSAARTAGSWRRALSGRRCLLRLRRRRWFFFFC